MFSRDAHAAQLMHQALGSSADAGSALLHFVRSMDEQQQAALLSAFQRHGTRE